MRMRGKQQYCRRCQLNIMAEPISTANPPTSTKRLDFHKQTLEDAYSVPANQLEIEVVSPETHFEGGKKKFTDYEINFKTNIPVFKQTSSTVRRRYSDFEWLKSELERDSKIVVPQLPGKALMQKFRGEGHFGEEFIEERKKGLEEFINKVAGHPLAQNEKCLHVFLLEPIIDKNYIPGKVRST